MSGDKRRFETLALHGGTYRADPASGAVAVPIYQTTSYQFQDTGHASRLFALEELGNIYTRVQNPTQDALEQRIAALEGGAGALAVASGQTASAYAVLNLAQAGDNIVSSTDLYGGTWTLFSQTLKQFGVEARFVDPTDPEAFRRATDAKTRAYYAEILPNPKLNVFPIKEVADIGRSARSAADCRQYGDAFDCQAAPAWRGGGRLFGDQIYRRTRHLDRRAYRRWRQLPLGRACRALSASDPTGRRISWCHLDGSREAARADRVCPARSRKTLARHRCGDLSLQCLSAHSGARDFAAPAAAAQRQRDTNCQFPQHASVRSRTSSSLVRKAASSAVAQTHISKAVTAR